MEKICKNCKWVGAIIEHGCEFFCSNEKSSFHISKQVRLPNCEHTCDDFEEHFSNSNDIIYNLKRFNNVES